MFEDSVRGKFEIYCGAPPSSAGRRVLEAVEDICSSQFSPKRYLWKGGPLARLETAAYQQQSPLSSTP